MIPFQRCNKNEAVITVSFSIILLLLISFTLGLLEQARIYGLRIRAKQATEVGIDSLFSMYYRPLLDRYGLLFLDEPTALGMMEKLGDLGGLEAVVYEQMAADSMPNLSLLKIGSGQYYTVTPMMITIPFTFRAVDNNGRYFVKNILSFMRYYGALEFVSSAHRYLTELNDSKDEVDQLNDEMTVSFEENEDVSETQPESDPSYSGDDISEEETKSIEEQAQEAVNNSIISEYAEILKNGILKLYGVNVNRISKKKIDLKKTISHGGYMNIGLDPIRGLEEEAMVNAYAVSFFSNYLGEVGNGVINYELEYILIGKASDKDNLSKALAKVYQARLTMNSLYVLKSANCKKQASQMAQKIVGFTQNAAIIAAVNVALLSMISATESILDMRALLKGKKVALMKTEKDFVTSLEKIPSLLQSDACAKESKLGIGYAGYLEMLLYTINSTEKVFRMMDVIDWNLKKDDPKFDFKKSIYGMEFVISFQANALFTKAMNLFPDGIVPKKYVWSVTDARLYE